MDLSVNYMGIALKNPILVGSSKLTASFESIKKCIEHGAGAIVLKSIFEEQLLTNVDKLLEQDDKYVYYPQAIDYINTYAKYQGVKEYIDLIKKVRSYSDVPLIASINCVSADEWPSFSRQFEQAGVNGIELNIAISPFDTEYDSAQIEQIYVDIVREVKKHTSVPVAVKIGNYFTNVGHITKRLVEAGADALVLFNRFYRPDINIDRAEIINDNFLSGPQEISQSLRWVALLSNKLNCSIAASTGIHDYVGVVKQIMAGADTVQLCSALYNKGTGYMDTLLLDLKKWMHKNNYKSIDDFKSKVSANDEYSEAFKRIQYMKRSIE